MDSKLQNSLTVYFAGELFSSKHLLGNALLAEAIWDRSNGKYFCNLPQNMEKRHETAHSIRDEDLKSLISADIGLFNYDGPELDSGTVVEYLFSKFADIPSVILRTDFRKGGDQETNHAWNLMTSFFPRTEVILIDSMALYKDALFCETEVNSPAFLYQKKTSHSAHKMINHVADRVIIAMDKVSKMSPIMQPEMRETIYKWLSMMPGFSQGHLATSTEILYALKQKIDKNLL